ncbi:MAG: DNA repair protein RecN, partial [Calditrichia bacterium]|nr:DNA repair protein RecN [Calditrichia bacterium]
EREQLIIRRYIYKKGNSKAFINDIPVNINTLKSIGDLLLDIHGQHEHQYLLNEHHHISYLDKLIDDESLLISLKEVYQQFVSIKKEYNKLKEDQRQVVQQKEFMEFQLKELDKANLQGDEYKELERQQKKLSNAEKIAFSCNKINNLINENEANLKQMLAEVQTEVGRLTEYENEFAIHEDELQKSEILFDELSRTVQEFGNSIEFSPQIQEEIEARMAELKRIMKKYQRDIPELIEFSEELKNKLQQFENYDDLLSQKEIEYNEIKKNYLQKCSEIHKIRKSSAQKFVKEILSELHDLGMSHARFFVEILKKEEKEENFSENGIDEVRFMISPNPGEDLKPLSKIASGGEISRIMLAIKKVFAEKDSIPSLIFDEIDLGVSGEMAIAIGKKIKMLAKSHQVICITHLPQIASLPGKHFKVEKKIKDGKTFVSIIELNNDLRIKEIASLIGGENVEQKVIESAEYLLQQNLTAEAKNEELRNNVQ